MPMQAGAPQRAPSVETGTQSGTSGRTTLAEPWSVWRSRCVASLDSSGAARRCVLPGTMPCVYYPRVRRSRPCLSRPGRVSKYKDKCCATNGVCISCCCARSRCRVCPDRLPWAGVLTVFAAGLRLLTDVRCRWASTSSPPLLCACVIIEPSSSRSEMVGGTPLSALAAERCRTAYVQPSAHVPPTLGISHPAPHLARICMRMPRTYVLAYGALPISNVHPPVRRTVHTIRSRSSAPLSFFSSFPPPFRIPELPRRALPSSPPFCRFP
ncbi:hypothetical protein PYCCODRAFT_276183 [Trametes coccinea BRFM310]|uniref:Uncharacterized protein n=1 Tax=Trametes coccinea (strain BRFM310) TaxID=1353009 RepID=A0A1Y2IQP1_TRAC3|nr:hypothetical protein PYCCODRAFT_276183 [Trametes coccinea BRFM310]